MKRLLEKCTDKFTEAKNGELSNCRKHFRQKMNIFFNISHSVSAISNMSLCHAVLLESCVAIRERHAYLPILKGACPFELSSRRLPIQTIQTD